MKKNNQILNSYFWYLCIILILVLSQCKPKQITKDDVTHWQTKFSGNTLDFVSDYVPQVVGSDYKSFEHNVDANEKAELHVVYGGSTALTFTDQKEYQNYMLAYQQLIHLRIATLLAFSNIERYSLSLSKPFYIKGETNPETEIQEFEVLRTVAEKEKVNAVLAQYPNFDPFRNPKLDSEEWKAISKSLQEVWKVELNELSRVTVE